MKLNEQLREDVTRLANGAASALSGLRDQFESHRSGAAASGTAISREEFDTVAAMVAKAREIQDDLLKRIAALEEKTGGGKTTGQPGEDI